MLQKERTQVITIYINDLSPSCTKYVHCTWYQHSCRNFWRLQEIHVGPLERFAVVRLQMTIQRNPLHKTRYYSTIM